MPNYAHGGNAQSRRALHVFYVLDTSGSMDGLPIERLNNAMVATMDALRQVAEHNGNAQIKVAVMEFNSNFRWMQPAGPEDAEDFLWENLMAAGLTNIGAAIAELDSKLSPDAFLRSSTGALMPVIIFMTDGFATDSYGEALARIRQNPFYAGATKVGFAIGEQPDTAMIADIVGSDESVIRTDDLGLFANLLRFVSVAGSKGASVVHGARGAYDGSDAVRAAMRQAGVAKSSDGFTVVHGSAEPTSLTPNTHPWDEPEW